MGGDRTTGSVQVPDDFMEVLRAVPGGMNGWELLTAEQQRDYVRRLEGASDPTDRERIVDESVQELTQQLAGKPPHASER